jgi:hypothetical protein
LRSLSFTFKICKSESLTLKIDLSSTLRILTPQQAHPYIAILGSKDFLKFEMLVIDSCAEIGSKSLETT